MIEVELWRIRHNGSVVTNTQVEQRCADYRRNGKWFNVPILAAKSNGLEFHFEVVEGSDLVVAAKSMGHKTIEAEVVDTSSTGKLLDMPMNEFIDGYRAGTLRSVDPQCRFCGNANSSKVCPTCAAKVVASMPKKRDFSFEKKVARLRLHDVSKWRPFTFTKEAMELVVRPAKALPAGKPIDLKTCQIKVNIPDCRCEFFPRPGRVIHNKSCPNFDGMVLCYMCGVLLDDFLSEGTLLCGNCDKAKLRCPVCVDGVIGRGIDGLEPLFCEHCEVGRKLIRGRQEILAREKSFDWVKGTMVVGIILLIALVTALTVTW